MSNRKLAELMHGFWCAEIRDPMRKEGIQVEEWSVQSIERHITKHMIEPCVHVATTIRQFKTIAHMLREDLQEKNKETGKKRVNLKVLRALLQVEDQLRQLYLSKTSRMLFYSSRLKLDDNRANKW